jgi:hypothetical protein
MIPFKSIKVGPFTVPIKKLNAEEEKKDLGLFRADVMTIWLNPKFENDQIEAETLLHEILHAIWSAWGLRDNKRDDQERIVSTLSVGLATVFSANARLVTYLKEKLS